MTRRTVLWAIAAGVATVFGPRLLPGGGADLSSSLQLDGGFFATLPILFAAGVLTSLTPCVYPLIPITVSIFGARGGSERGRAAALSGTYVLGIATMYSGLGVAAAASGKAFGSVMGNPVVVSVFALVMLAFALSMFGLYEISVPAGLMAKLQGVRGFGFGSAFGMGLVAGIIAAPCTGPVLGAVLTFVAATQQLAVGFWLLFAYALGMGLLFFVLGTFSVKLPRSGAWMESVKTVLGVALMLVAFSFVRPFVFPKPPEVAISPDLLGIFAGLLVAAAVLSGAVSRSFHGPASERLLKLGGLVVLTLALAGRLEWVVGADRVGSVVAVADAETPPPSGGIAWLHDEAEALRVAKVENKPILIDFYADWCTACTELDKFTFTDPRVRAEVAAKFVALKVDGTEETDETRALQQKYGVVGLPLVTVVSPDGRQLPSPKVAGFLEAEPFLKELAKVKLD
jgi:thiol:disulfide interchange protein DsbD